MLHSLILATLSLIPAQAADSVFDIPKFLAPPLQARTLKRTETAGIVTEEVMFHSETDGAKQVEIFAYFSYPAGAAKLPAFIWNQGGLYKATTYWTEFGAKRGYATLCIDFPIPGYRSTGGYPINSGLELTADPRQAPIYHGAVALLRAVSFLQSRPEVDAGRIGMAGSSWGGFFTTLMIGLDDRLKAGSSMFGCGAMQLGNLWWDGRGWDLKRDQAFRERWAKSLDPAARLPRSKTPMAWFTGTNDQFYWLPSVMRSHAAAAGPKHLSLLPNWNHALTEELDEQVFAWLDMQLKGGKPFLQVSPLEVRAEDALAQWTFTGQRKPARAELVLSCGDAGNWTSRCWQTLPAAIDGKWCTAKLPGGSVPYFISGTIIDDAGFRYSTPMQRVTGVQSSSNALQYDGCALWGGFEPEQVVVCARHGWPITVSDRAKVGKQCGVAKGKWVSPPVLGTPGVEHRLTCWLNASKPGEVRLALRGHFDGMPGVVDTTVQVAGWQQATLDFSFPRTLTGALNLEVLAPAGSEVFIDQVQFQPLTK